MSFSINQTGILTAVTNLAGLVSGLIIAALSLWFSYKSRKTSVAQALFQKQIEVYNELAALMAQKVVSFNKALTPEDKIPEAIRENLRSAIQDDASILAFQQRAMMLLPNSVLKAIQAYADVVYEVHNARTVQEASDSITKAMFAVCLAIRMAAGVDPLTEDVQGISRTNRAGSQTITERSREEEENRMCVCS